MIKKHRVFYSANIRFLYASVLLMILISACAGTNAEHGAYQKESPPCENCATGQPIELSVRSKKETLWMDSAWVENHRTSPKTLISAPSVFVDLQQVEKCSFCHSLSPDALDFDFGNRMDSLLGENLGFSEQAVFWPGAHIPTADSAEWRQILAEIQSLELKSLEEVKNHGTLGELLHNYAEKWDLSYLSLPLRIEVIVHNKKGKSGAFEWKSLWTLWDVAAQKPLIIADLELFCATHTRTTPD